MKSFREAWLFAQLKPHAFIPGQCELTTRNPVLRGVRGKLDFTGNLLPSAGPCRKKFYSLITHFVFHFFRLCVFFPALYNSEQGSRRGAGKAEQLQFTSVKNSKSPEDKGSCLRSLNFSQTLGGSATQDLVIKTVILYFLRNCMS